jgi:hypothetical protein
MCHDQVSFLRLIDFDDRIKVTPKLCAERNFILKVAQYSLQLTDFRLTASYG